MYEMKKVNEATRELALKLIRQTKEIYVFEGLPYWCAGAKADDGEGYYPIVKDISSFLVAYSAECILKRNGIDPGTIKWVYV